MALFSRRPKKPEPTPPTPEPGTDLGREAAQPAGEEPVGRTEPPITAGGAAPGETPLATNAAAPEATDAAAASPAARSESSAAGESEADAAPTGAEAVPDVSISVSSFGGLGVSPSTQAPASSPRAEPEAVPPGPQPRLGVREWMRTAPAQTETLPGLRDNVLLRAALGRVGDAPPNQALLDVARQLLQGHVFLRVKGDAKTLLAEGKGLPLAVATAGERTFALVYSSGAALQASLQADGDADTSAMAQPVLTVLRHVFGSSYDGIILDPASAPSRAVLPKELLQRAVEQADPQLTIKTLLAAERTPQVTADVAQALTHAPLWVAVGTAEGGARGLAEGRTPDGSRYLEIYSHPLEVAVMRRGDNAAPITGDQLARALRADEGISGVVVDPAGPWLRLTREDLAPVLALAG
ncbi:SseB family protein [Microbacterium timonense]|uniref:SseB family protein n=1 Tax=Microbacterium timonense TaxID=2086576 RepID=UPI000D1000D1|nr:SseB family protein [Microbacterium timonense]